MLLKYNSPGAKMATKFQVEPNQNLRHENHNVTQQPTYNRLLPIVTEQCDAAKSLSNNPYHCITGQLGYIA
jgi:hypothetical protein